MIPQKVKISRSGYLRLKYYNFFDLLKFSENDETSRKRKRNNADEEETEAHYEKQPRVLQDEMENQHVLLPIKSHKGFIQRVETKAGKY